MQVYNFSLKSPTLSSIDDVQNGVLLRKDIHFAFDQKTFCLVVKEGVVVSHYLKPTNELAALYHNAEFCLPGAQPAVEFFWARFAWSILPLVGPFESNMRLWGRVPAEPLVGQEGQLEEDDAVVTPKARKRRNQDPESRKSKRAGRASRRGSGGASSNTVARDTRLTSAARATSDITNPYTVTKRQLALEKERDKEIRERSFPRMSKYLPSS